LASRGKSRRSAFLKLTNQSAWIDFTECLLNDENELVSAVRRRTFHVTVWNSLEGHARGSIGNISASDDRDGAYFARTFGAVKWPDNDDAAKRKEKKVSTMPTLPAAPLLCARLSAERRRRERAANGSSATKKMMKDNLGERLGATCRTIVGDRSECSFKFPKTLHCKDLGAMASDDLLLSRSELDLFFGREDSASTVRIRVEEKVDGSNIGISLHPSDRNASDGRPSFRFQKRSHYVSTASEWQYRGLDRWAQSHARALRKLLRMPLGAFGVRMGDDDDQHTRRKPALIGQRVVFGEWLAASHSKRYDSLPSMFLVFDIFDSSLRNGRGGFVSANVRDRMLRHVVGADGIDPRTGREKKLWRVRTCALRSFSSPEELVKILYHSPIGRTAYAKSSDRCEGFYLRFDDDASGLLRARCKLVHGDFHQLVDGGRWERSRERNVVRPDAWLARDDDGKEVKMPPHNGP